MARSNMSRTTDLGLSAKSRTQGWLEANTSNDCASRSASGFGYVISSSSAMRSSYSMPSRFIAATASPRALYSCCERMARGSSRVASMTLTTSRA
jgi:hypothetical protein